MYAVFFSGLDTYYSPVYDTRGNSGDFKVKMIPTGDKSKGQQDPAGQVYVVLSKADGVKTKISDENTISGVGILEVLPVGVRS